MKNNRVSTWIGSGLLALSLAVLPSALPASAQTPAAPTTPGVQDPVTPGTPTTPDPIVPGATSPDPVAPNATTTTPDDNDGFSWGWLGLLGLFGLAGLAGRNRETSTYATTDRSVTSTNPTTDPRF